MTSQVLSSTLRWPILAIVLIAAIHFTGIYKYKGNLVEKAIMTIKAKTSNRTTVTATDKPLPISLQRNTPYNPPKICGTEWQSKYEALHHDVINNRREPKFLVYSCPWTNEGCCGYGNRVAAVVNLFYLAILTDRAFLIDWDAPKPLERFLKPKRINWTYPIPNVETRKHYWRTGGHAQRVREGWLTKNLSEVVQLVQNDNFSDFFDKPVEVVASILDGVQHGIRKSKQLMKRARELKIKPLLKGYAQRFNLIGCAFDFLFDKTPRLQNALQNTRKALRSNNAFVIGIHVRLGDVQFGRTVTRVAESEFPKFFSCAEKVEKEIFRMPGVISRDIPRNIPRDIPRGISRDIPRGIPGKIPRNIPREIPRQTRWFLAADSVLVKDYAKKHFGEKVITSEIKPEHLDMFKKGEKPPSDEGMLGVLHDHFILAECDFLVLTSDSSFGWTAVGVSMRSRDTYTFGENCDLKLKNKV